MADQRDGGIAWTDATWNPIRGCSRISEGCRNCYAEVVAGRFSGPGLAYEGLAKQTSAGARWTGKVVVVEKHLYDPLRWSRPRRIFANSMSDLFHESLTVETIAEVFAVMYLAHQHQFQVLTKRAERMRRVLNDPSFYPMVLKSADAARRVFSKINVGISNPSLHPHANVWLGVSVEDQATADLRCPELLATPAAVRWLSIEPQIGPVDLNATPMRAGTHPVNGFTAEDCRGCLPQWQAHPMRAKLRDGIDWVVIGGESGGGARPFDIGWARSLVAQCRTAGVPAFVKQLGAVPVEDLTTTGNFRTHQGKRQMQMTATALRLDDRKGGDMTEWPPELRVREFPEVRT